MPTAVCRAVVGVGAAVEPHLLQKLLGRRASPGSAAIFKWRRAALAVAAQVLQMDNGGLLQDMLSLPTGAGLVALLLRLDVGSSCVARRRAARRLRQDSWLQEGIAVPNEWRCQGRHVQPDTPRFAPQRRAARRLAFYHWRVAPPQDCPSPHATCQLLQGLRPGFSEVEASGSRAVYQRGSISLRVLLETGQGLLRSPSEARALLEEARPPPAMDPKLARRGFDYGWALTELFEANILELAEGQILEETR